MTAMPSERDLDARAQALLDRMTLREKASLLSGRDEWYTVPIERLGLPSIVVTDGPHGVRAADGTGRPYGPATSFPTGSALAATFDPELIEKVGGALAREARAFDCDLLLGPCINIVRHPLAGRNFECYSEDPYLAGRIAVGFIRGVQAQGVGTALKHFACNNQETERTRASSEVDERTLREIYLPAFEMAVKEASPWTVMCSYNRLNGAYASESAWLLTKVLRDEWGFTGAVMSDWGATHDTVNSVRAGLDLEMPGPARHFGLRLVDAVQSWQLDGAVVDTAARRIIKTVLRLGRADGPVPSRAANTAEHQALARQVAREAMVLLKNDRRALPLELGAMRLLAVIGPNVADFRITGGGSACVDPPYRVDLLEVLAAKVRAARPASEEPSSMRYAAGCDNFREPPVLATELVRPAQGKGRGLWLEFFRNTRFAGAAELCRVDARIDHWCFGPGLNGQPDAEEFSARWTGKLLPKHTGPHAILVRHTAVARLRLDGRTIVDSEAPVCPSDAAPDAALAVAQATVELVAGREYDLEVDFVRGKSAPFASMQVRFAPAPVEPIQERIRRAVALAADADAAVVIVGMPDTFETEGRDRAGLELPGDQDELIAAIAEVNPRTIVVVNCGSPIAMPWASRVAAILLAHYPGQEGAHALVEILTGEANPAGKLPMTYPRRLEDVPAFLSLPGERQVHYGEGLFVGYRHYDRRDIEPLFPFGHGLSYTTFEYGALQAPAQSPLGRPVRVAVTVENQGQRAGAEVVQLYVGERNPTVARPIRELKRFAKVELLPGQSKTIEFLLDERAFACFDTASRSWRVHPGEYELMAGSSSRDIRSRAIVRLALEPSV